MKHKERNIIVFEGVHGVGKSTLLNDLHDPDGGVVYLYNHDMWNDLKDAKTLVEDKVSYNSQFVNSLKSQIYFIDMMLSTKQYHTILIDRWYLTSLLYSLLDGTYINEFGDVGSLFKYVNTLEKYLYENFNLQTLVFKLSDETLLDDLYYDINKNKSESRILDTLKSFIEPTNKHEIYLDKVDGVFDIKEKFITFVKSKQ